MNISDFGGLSRDAGQNQTLNSQIRRLECKINEFSWIDKMLFKPSLIMMKLIQDINAPRSSFCVSMLSNIGVRVLGLVQAVLSAVALPFRLMHCLLTLHFSSIIPQMRSSLLTYAHAALIPLGITIAFLPQRIINLVSPLSRIIQSSINNEPPRNADLENLQRESASFVLREMPLMNEIL